MSLGSLERGKLMKSDNTVFKNCSADIVETNRFVGQQIRGYRNLMKMSQKCLGNILGVSFQQVQKYESAANKISGGRLFMISESFKIPVTAFFPQQEIEDWKLSSWRKVAKEEVLTEDEQEILYYYKGLPKFKQKHFRAIMQLHHAHYNSF